MRARGPRRKQRAGNLEVAPPLAEKVSTPLGQRVAHAPKWRGACPDRTSAVLGACPVRGGALGGVVFCAHFPGEGACPGRTRVALGACPRRGSRGRGFPSAFFPAAAWPESQSAERRTQTWKTCAVSVTFAPLCGCIYQGLHLPLFVWPRLQKLMDGDYPSFPWNLNFGSSQGHIECKARTLPSVLLL